MANWCNNSVAWTASCEAVSVVFPAWEKAFAAVATHYLDVIKDPELQDRMRSFIAEELSHAAAHSAFNRRNNLQDLEDAEHAKTAVVLKSPKRKLWLGTMISIEHFASCMSRMYLVNCKGDDRDHKLFAWHAREELGHKALAFDVWRALGYSDKLLVQIVRRNQIYVLKAIFRHVTAQVKAAGKLKDWVGYIVWFGKFVRWIGIPMLQIYLPKFHPNHTDDSRFMEVYA